MDEKIYFYKTVFYPNFFKRWVKIYLDYMRLLSIFSIIFAVMKELSRHIETLLFENDCVIIPNFGGFITHYIPSTRDEEEQLFIPPMRMVGFNEQLKLNDGLLVQSYMSVYNTSFSDASKQIDKKVSKLKEELFEDGKVLFPNIGELHYTTTGAYEFTPFNNKLTTPSLYGLDTFRFLSLEDLKKRSIQPVEDKKNYNIRINRFAVRSVASVAAMLFMFFFLSTPVENTEIVEGNYAQLSFTELLNNLGEKPLTLVEIQGKELKEKNTQSVQQPIRTKEVKVSKPISSTASTTSQEKKVTETVVQVKPVSTPSVTTTTAVSTNVQSKNFHIIVASSIPLDVAMKEVDKLHDLGYDDAQIIQKGDIVRISIISSTDKNAAYQNLNKIRQNEKFQDAWMFTE